MIYTLRLECQLLEGIWCLCSTWVLKGNCKCCKHPRILNYELNKKMQRKGNYSIKDEGITIRHVRKINGMTSCSSYLLVFPYASNVYWKHKGSLYSAPIGHAWSICTAADIRSCMAELGWSHTNQGVLSSWIFHPWNKLQISARTFFLSIWLLKGGINGEICDCNIWMLSRFRTSTDIWQEIMYGNDLPSIVDNVQIIWFFKYIY